MINKNAWLVRPYPNNMSRIEEFQAQNIIAIGWPGIGDLNGKTKQDIREILSREPYDYTGLALGNACACVDIFVNQMHAGDFVLTPDGDNIHLGVIESDYFFNPEFDELEVGYSHQREVKWCNKLSRDALSKNLRSSLKVHRTTANLSAHCAEIEALCLGKSVPVSVVETSVKISYPLRPDFSINFEVPSDMTKEEAERLNTFISTLYFRD